MSRTILTFPFRFLSFGEEFDSACLFLRRCPPFVLFFASQRKIVHKSELSSRQAMERMKTSVMQKLQKHGGKFSIGFEFLENNCEPSARMNSVFNIIHEIFVRRIQ